MSEETKPDTFAKWRRRLTLAGVVVALACNLAPPQYREICHAVADICTGAF